MNVRKRWLALIGSIIAVVSSFLTSYINSQITPIEANITIGDK